MHPYLLRNDNTHHAERLALEAWYAKKHGRRVTYADILHELQAREVRKLKLKV
jgi:hypothetical protein